jgi:hypothetical protein
MSEDEEVSPVGDSDKKDQVQDSDGNSPQNGEQPNKEVQRRLDQQMQPRRFGGAGTEKRK